MRQDRVLADAERNGRALVSADDEGKVDERRDRLVRQVLQDQHRTCVHARLQLDFLQALKFRSHFNDPMFQSRVDFLDFWEQLKVDLHGSNDTTV